MPRAKSLTLQSIDPGSGRCPWRIGYRIDNIHLSAFFRQPWPIRPETTHRDVALIALPILCELAAQVRPISVSLGTQKIPPTFRQVFDDALGALILEQDAYWGKPRLTSLPQLHGTLGKAKVSTEPLAPNRVVLGFSGGKDSIVSLFALLHAGYEVIPVLLNEGDRTWQDLRRWIPKLRGHALQPMIGYLSIGSRKLLRDRYGDWHFSSYQLGWLTATLALCALETKSQIICLGIEASADHSFTTISGRRINHQHQKTTRHLKLLERFYQNAVHQDLKIASPIAGATDPEVLKVLLTKVTRSFQEFSSCGSSNWRSKHCGRCLKCAFIYVLLLVTDSGMRLANRIFRRDLMEDVGLYQPWLDPGFPQPLACIGPRVEVWDALEVLLQRHSKKPVLEAWKNSQLRRQYCSFRSSRKNDVSAVKTGSPLARPVSDAAILIRTWARGFDES